MMIKLRYAMIAPGTDNQIFMWKRVWDQVGHYNDKKFNMMVHFYPNHFIFDKITTTDDFIDV